MAIVNNTLSEIGDVLTIKTQLAIRGDIALTSFTDVVSGETGTRLFSKTFRYSFDNINWSPILPLTDLALTEITGKVPGLLFFEFYYERSGSDASGLLEFESILIVGTIDVQICLTTSTIDSIFEGLACNNELTYEIANNLLRKIYYSGILPDYIERGEGIEDEDFIALWSAVCFFMAMLINFSNTFDEILYNRKNLSESLTQRGLIVCENDTILDDLQYLANNYKDEIRKRGTQAIYRAKGELNSYDEETPIDGEWIRLLCKNHYDEFLVEVMERKHMGFCVGNSSVLYNGTCGSRQINKTPENGKEFIDLDLYDWSGSVAIVSGGDVRIKGVAEGFSGFGHVIQGSAFEKYDELPDTDKVFESDWIIPIDREMDYEITFNIQKRVADLTNMKLYFGVGGYNRNGIFKPLSFQSIGPTNVQQMSFLWGELAEDIMPIQDQYYQVRGIIYAERSEQQSDLVNYVTNIGKGRNLRFYHNGECEAISICLYTDSTNTAHEVFVNDLKMRPLVRGKNVLKTIFIPTDTRPMNIEYPPNITNPHFIQQGNTIYSWMKNNNETMTDNQVVNFIERYLIPYQQKLVSVFLSPKVDDKQLLT